MEYKANDKKKQYLSCLDNFEDEEMSASDMYDTLGGIEKVGVLSMDVVGNSVSESVWDVKYAGEDLYSWRRNRNVRTKNNFYFIVWFLRILVLYVYNAFRNKSN